VLAGGVLRAVGQECGVLGRRHRARGCRLLLRGGSVGQARNVHVPSRHLLAVLVSDGRIAVGKIYCNRKRGKGAINNSVLFRIAAFLISIEPLLSCETARQQSRNQFIFFSGCSHICAILNLIPRTELRVSTKIGQLVAKNRARRITYFFGISPADV
jgi:hypothetical protein